VAINAQKHLKQTCLQALLNHFFSITLQGGFKDFKGLLDLICPDKAIFQGFHSVSIFANVFSFFFICCCKVHYDLETKTKETIMLWWIVANAEMEMQILDMSYPRTAVIRLPMPFLFRGW